jgi:hypothetical protein
MSINLRRESHAPRGRFRPGRRKMNLDRLLQSEVRVINIGLREFARDLESRATPVVHVDWSPPAATNAKIGLLLAKMGG